MQPNLNQPIQVQAKFSNGQIIPQNFTWRQTTFTVEKILLVHTKRHGQAMIYSFNLQSNQTIYQISFHNLKLTWRLNYIYEGQIN